MIVAPRGSGYDGTMTHGSARTRLGRTALAVVLGYVLALQLLLVGLDGSSQAARALGVRADLDGVHALCAPDRALDAASDATSGPAGPARAGHGACCTLACLGGPALDPPRAATIERPAPRATRLARAWSVDLGARPATAPPGRGRGPRAPPSDLT